MQKFLRLFCVAGGVVAVLSGYLGLLAAAAPEGGQQWM